MQKRLILLLVLLVILPAAVLSLLAVHALRGWELLLERRLQVGADQAVRAVVSRIERRLHDDLGQVTTAMSDCLRRGYTPGRASDCIAALKSSRDLVEEGFLFMNPWGLVYPERGGVQQGMAGAQEADDPLVAVLRQDIATGTGRDFIQFRLGGRAYCFQAVEGSSSLFAGYRVAERALHGLVRDAISGMTAEGFVLEARGPGLNLASRESEAGAVVISDSLGGEAVAMTGARDPGQGSKPIARGRLAPPLDTIEITAFALDPDAFAISGRHEARLYAWAAFVLAIGIGLGGWVILRSANEEMRRTRARSDFVLGVSHDLRTPLASMRVLAESLYLDRVEGAEKKKRFLQTILSECERLNQLVERVLFLVRFGQDALIYSMRKQDLGELVGESIRVFRARLGEDAGRVDIKLQTEADLPMVSADQLAITQVMLNLLDNAYKYGTAGRHDGDQEAQHVMEETDGESPPAPSAPPARLSILVTLDAVKGLPGLSVARRTWIRIRVSDNGPGMRSADVRQIFNPFFRTPEARNNNVSGVGLGLALCRHVLRAHNGRITAESQPGKGSTFSLYLPV